MAKRKKCKHIDVYDFILMEPVCSRCHKTIVGVGGFKDVRVQTSPSVYDRRHFAWICEPCLHTVLKHAQIAS